MTCIAGLIHEGKVYIGGDSASSDGDLNVILRKDPKVFKVTTEYTHSKIEMLFGFSGSFRMGQILMLHLDLPEYSNEESYEFVVRSVIPEIINTFNTHKHVKDVDGAGFDGSFLIGFQGRLFYIDSDFQVGESIDPFDACGIAAPFARASLAITTKHCDMEPKDHIIEALELAERYNGTVRGPFNIVSL